MLQINIAPILEKFNALQEDIMPFLTYESLPETKSQIISYMNKCNVFEANLISIKSELIMTKADVDRDYRALYRKTQKSLGLSQKWESKLNTEMDPAISDIKASIDKLEGAITIINDYKWTFKFIRDTAKIFTMHVNEIY